MSIIVNANSADLLIGLQWSRVLPGEAEFGKTLEVGRRIKARYRVRYVSDGVVAIGVAGKPTGKLSSKKSPVLCAAILFAKLVHNRRNAIYIYPTDDEACRLIVVVDGVPYLECVCAQDAVAARIDALRVETQVDFALYGECEGLKNITEMPVEEMLSAGSTGAGVANFTDTRSLKTIATIGVVVVSILGANEANKIRLKKIEEEQERVLAIDPINAYTESLNRLLSKAGFSGTSALNAYWQPVADREIVQSGWKSTAMRFKGATAVLSWQKLPGANEQGLKAALGEHITVSPNGQLWDSIEKVSVTKTALLRMKLPENTKFVQRLKQEEEQMAGVGIRLAYQPPRLAGMPPGLVPSQIPPRITVSKGTLTISGRLGQMAEVLNSLETNIAVDELAIALAGSVEEAKFEVKGTYYVKN